MLPWKGLLEKKKSKQGSPVQKLKDICVETVKNMNRQTTMDVLMNSELEFSDLDFAAEDEGEVLTPRSSVISVQQ